MHETQCAADTGRPMFLKPCGANGCPQSPRCLRANGVDPFSFEPRAGWLKGCPWFIDRRGVALLQRTGL